MARAPNAFSGSLAIAVAALAAAGAARAGCRADFIAQISPQGTQIGTGQSGLYQVLAQTIVDVATWQPGNHLSICTYQAVPRFQLFTMINTSRSESLEVAVPQAGVAEPVHAAHHRR